MRFVDNDDITDPRINLAIEEYLLRQVTSAEPLLLFYINEPSVIIGRNQNTAEEIDHAYVKDKGIHVVRRLSGGGAVYHDLGNLNFSFITQGRGDLHNFAKFTEPVVRALNQLDVPAELKGKSDIFAEGKKISGNAQYSAGGRMFSHGTLLFNTSIEEMLKALNPGQAAIESKAVQSVRNFVTNIRELLPVEMDIHGLKQAILAEIFGQGRIPTLEITPADWAGIRRISSERYATWEWNYGHSPKFDFQKSQRFPAGKIDVRLSVERGRIKSLKIYGDFAGQRDVDELESILVGRRHDGDDLAAALEGVALEPYFGLLAPAEFLSLLV